MRTLTVEIFEDTQTHLQTFTLWLQGKAPQRTTSIFGWKEFAKRCGATTDEIDNAKVNLEKI